MCGGSGNSGHHQRSGSQFPRAGLCGMDLHVQQNESGKGSVQLSVDRFRRGSLAAEIGNDPVCRVRRSGPGRGSEEISASSVSDADRRRGSRGQSSRRPERTAETGRSHSCLDFPGGDPEMERSGNCQKQSRSPASESADHSGPPLRRFRHHLDLHELSEQSL